MTNKLDAARDAAWETWKAAQAAGLVGSREANLDRPTAISEDLRPKDRRFLELGFPCNFWLPLRIAEAWRTDAYPARATAESIRAWLLVSDELLKPEFDRVDLNVRAREAHQQDVQLVQQQARSIWDRAVDCPEAKNLESVLLAAAARNRKQQPRPRTKRILPSMKRDEANRRVADLLKKTECRITQRAMAEQITDESGFNCSTGLIANTIAWQESRKAVEERRRPPAPRGVTLTPELLATQGEKDKALEALINEQQEDSEPSPLDAAPARTKRQRKRV